MESTLFHKWSFIFKPFIFNLYIFAKNTDLKSTQEFLKMGNIYLYSTKSSPTKLHINTFLNFKVLNGTSIFTVLAAVNIDHSKCGATLATVAYEVCPQSFNNVMYTMYCMYILCGPHSQGTVRATAQPLACAS